MAILIGTASWTDKSLVDSKQELNEFADPIRTLASATRQVHVVFNNNFGNYAQRNAAELIEILQG